MNPRAGRRPVDVIAIALWSAFVASLLCFGVAWWAMAKSDPLWSCGEHEPAALAHLEHEGSFLYRMAPSVIPLGYSCIYPGYPTEFHDRGTPIWFVTGGTLAAAGVTTAFAVATGRDSWGNGRRPSRS